MIELSDMTKKSGNELFKKGDCEEAIKKYTECLEIDPYNVLYHSIVLCNRAAC